MSEAFSINRSFLITDYSNNRLIGRNWVIVAALP